jgi:hypothetical protein
MKKLIFISLLISTLSAFAQSIGTILVAVNNVSAEQGTQKRTLSRGSAINTGDTIITGPNSHAQLKYSNGTLVTIQQNTRYQTTEYDPKKAVSLKSNLSTGAIEYKSTGKKKGVIQTPVVALAILGTDFQAIATPTQTYLNVIEGLVSADGVIVGPGQTNTSGSFNTNNQFVPGTIPWNAAVGDSASNDVIMGAEFTDNSYIDSDPDLDNLSTDSPSTNTQTPAPLTTANTAADVNNYDSDYFADNDFDFGNDFFADVSTETTIVVGELVPTAVVNTAINAILALSLPPTELATITLLFP